jgi:transcriptional regulator with XRE-family HTH domain
VTLVIKVELYPDEYLRLMRSRLEMTQAELARRLGIERRTVMRYENGIFKIPPAQLHAVEQMAEQNQ